MENKVIQISDLLQYHDIKESFRGGIACIRLDPGLVNIGTAPASYMDMFSFFVVLRGKTSFDINYRKVEIGRGDMLLMFPSLLVRLTEQSRDFVGMHLLCERRLFEHLLTDRPVYQQYSLFFRTRFPVVHLPDNRLKDMVGVMRQVAHHIAEPYPHQEEILLHLLHVFLLQTLAFIEEKGEDASPDLNHAETVFQQFIGLLTQHYRQQHQIEFYAGKLCMSTTYLSRIIRKVTGKTANYFISGLLYSEACRMLVHTDRTVAAIADELCFADQSSFGKFFKTHAKVSPLGYRAQGKDNSK